MAHTQRLRHSFGCTYNMNNESYGDKWKDFVVLSKNKTIMFHADNHDYESYGYLNWCTTEVENLEFY